MKKILMILVGGFILRLFLVFVAYHGDLNNNISWGTLAVERGLYGFYESGNWPYSAPNQPPLMILTFAFLRLIWLWVEKLSWFLNRQFSIFPSAFIWFWESRAMILLVKLPSILADLTIGYLIYKYFERKGKRGQGLKISSLWLINPITWYNSSLWGQTDSVVNLLGLVAVFALIERNLVWFVFFMTLSFLFKASLAIFVPILLFIAYGQKHSLKTWLQALAGGLFSFLSVSLWFHPKFDIFLWFFRLYKDRILPGETGYLTVNAFNFWWLVNPGRVLDSTKIFGLTARNWGFLVFLILTVLILRWISKKTTEKRILVSLSFVSLASFLFLTRIHERYLYPFFPYATIIFNLSRSFVISYFILSLTYLLNLYNLFWAPSIKPLELALTSPILPRLISFVNITIFFYLLRLLRSPRL